MIKSKKQSPQSSAKSIQIVEEEYVIQKIARIDGQQTVKKYKKCELLGKGGFANCFATQNLQTKKRAATKVIQKQLLTSQKTKLRLLNEIRLHKTLHHQNIVEFQHYFQDKNKVYIFLELCENQSLNEVIKTRQYFSTPEIQSFIYGIVKGLKYLHGKSIIHRDLKLGNIFLDKDFNIKLGDFGLATKLQFRKQYKRTICGTPNYIAPEILEGKGYHFQIDIWSIGVILYTLYFTIPPFQTEQASTTYQKIKKCEYSFPKNMLVPQEALQLIKRILVKNPSQRPTLDEILQSDFMKIGNKIYKQLPSICSRRMPNKKDLSNMAFYTHNEILQQINSQKQKIQATINTQTENVKIGQNLTFLTNFQSLGEEKFFYTLNNGVTSIFTPNQIVFKDQYGTIRGFNPNQKTKKLRSCEQNPLKYLLNCKDKLNNLQKQSCSSLKAKAKQVLFQATLYPTQIPLHIKKVSQQSKHNFYMIRLSNQTIQLMFQDSVDYLINGKGDEITEIKKGKASKTINLKEKYSLSQKDGGQINQKKFKYIQGILSQIKVIQERLKSRKHCKENNQQGEKQLSKCQSELTFNTQQRKQMILLKENQN